MFLTRVYFIMFYSIRGICPMTLVAPPFHHIYTMSTFYILIQSIYIIINLIRLFFNNILIYMENTHYATVSFYVIFFFISHTVTERSESHKI